ncbi:MAG TPA: DEAD/DEAH box helicase family protein, partial [Casimicrobiaceae bacterium]|nr:DEAD/DEAH box helicase family protein [Casimicrobiaceae bacterium]
MAIARVAMPIAAWQLFDYWIPEGLDVARGDIVKARLGGRKYLGVVNRIDATSDVGAQLQPIDAVTDIARLPEETIALAEFVSDYYQAPPGLAHALLVPPSTRARRTPRVTTSERSGAASPPLNADQMRALDALVANENAFSVTMLHGITGSGKTLVYLSAATRAIARGGQVLVLVPEINLTPQFERRVGNALPDAQAVTLHSRLS